MTTPPHRVTRAMILGAGEGVRLRPLTLTTPKIMIPINGIPQVTHTLLWLKSHGITDVAINLHHLGHQIKTLVGDGSRLGLNVVFSEEHTLLGTAGGVKKMESFLGDRFVIVYGDILTDFDLTAMIQRHLASGAVATIALFRPSNPHEVGLVQMDPAGRILKFVEKPPTVPPELFPPQANAGIYVLEKTVLEHVPPAGKCDFGFETFPHLIAAGLPLCGHPIGPHDYLIDIGTQEKYRLANEDARRGRIKMLSESDART
jgi:NDP-sugar pyrophosphorylase family protein